MTFSNGRQDSFQLPKGVYKGHGGQIILEESALCIQNKNAFGRMKRIPYESITGVLYVRPEKRLGSKGFLIIRDRANRDKPMPCRYSRMTDHYSITFSYESYAVFYHIFCVLRYLAPPETMFQIETPRVTLPDLDGQAEDEKMDLIFERYNPNRQLATAALCGEWRLNLPTAWAITDRAFDMRQQAMYQQNPILAVRDLNRVLITDSAAPLVYKGQ